MDKTFRFVRDRRPGMRCKLEFKGEKKFNYLVRKCGLYIQKCSSVSVAKAAFGNDGRNAAWPASRFYFMCTKSICNIIPLFKKNGIKISFVFFKKQILLHFSFVRKIEISIKSSVITARECSICVAFPKAIL